MIKTTMLILLTLAFSPVVMAADFVFKVPINFTQLVDISKVKVSCQISTQPGFSQNNIKGSNTVFQNTSNNSVNTTIIVPVNMGQGVQSFGLGGGQNNRDLIKYWRCSSQVCTNNSSCRELSVSENQLPFKAKAGAQLTMKRSGNF